VTTEQHMQRAIDLAQSVLTASPNPRVGCVIVRDGEVVGEGWHVRPGEAHAEVNALAMAGTRAAGATVYVSLEPCAHTGKTPPCADALISACVGEVIYASPDPNPLVAGKGLERLRSAGIRVSGPVLQDRADAINPGFIKRMTEGLPWVRCKMAMSLDGRTAMASGESKWITGPASRADVQRMRAASCAVVTSINTVISDNPSLNVRVEQMDEADLTALRDRQPRRVIIDSGLRTPPDSKILSLPGDVLLLTCRQHEQQLARFVGVDAEIRNLPMLAGGRVDLHAAMQCLAQDYGCNEVMLEAGPTLSGAMVQAGLIDEVIIYIGARFLGSDALPLFNLPGIDRMQDHIGLKITDVLQIEDGCRITARLRRV
jgi:diaminohydroxyphosphoribosylaminopyrimidine deaminase / 5-amino-6-(5-phosphoribosylamino)uracil reductase